MPGLGTAPRGASEVMWRACHGRRLYDEEAINSLP